MEKIRYETDPYNRLVIGTGAGLKRQRRVIDGVFRIDGDNTLSYHSRSPINEGSTDPYRLKLDGRWSLTKDHDLRVTIDSEKMRATYAITLCGEIIEARGDSLLFALSTTDKDKSRRTYTLRLSGRWQADESNRLTFAVYREAGRADILKLDATWDIGKDNQLIYRYERRSRVRGPRIARSIAFRGRWQFSDPLAVTYEIEAGSNSAFRFKSGIARCMPDRIEYEIGVGAARHLRPSVRTIILYGRWMASRRAGLTFDGEFAHGKAYSLSFGAQARLTGDDTLELTLKDRSGKELGIELELRHEMIGGDGSAFIRLLKSSGESGITVGGSFSW